MQNEMKKLQKKIKFQRRFILWLFLSNSNVCLLSLLFC